MIDINGKTYYGIIYKIENIITHYVYIGQTTHPKGFNGRYYYKGTGIERVYNDLKSKKDRGERYNKHLFRSIEKCGFDAFVVDQLFDVALTKDELNRKESYYIKEFDSYKNGYNMSFGGDSISGYHRPSGKDCPNSKRVCQISLDGKLIKTWNSATEASIELGISLSSISNVCKGHIKTAGGFVWIYEKDYDINKDYKRTPQKKDMGRGTKPVLLLSGNNDIIQEFYSVNYAGEVLGISGQEVSRICLHKAKTIKYNLVYKNEYMEEQRLNAGTFMSA